MINHLSIFFYFTYFRDVCKELENQKFKMESKTVEPRISAPGTTSSQSQRRREPVRNFEEPDSLLPTSVLNQMASNNNFTIRPRSTAEVNEEYQVIISNLRLLVDKVIICSYITSSDKNSSYYSHLMNLNNEKLLYK